VAAAGLRRNELFDNHRRDFNCYAMHVHQPIFVGHRTLHGPAICEADAARKRLRLIDAQNETSIIQKRFDIFEKCSCESAIQQIKMPLTTRNYTGR
jgi:hypothetical protein